MSEPSAATLEEIQLAWAEKRDVIADAESLNREHASQTPSTVFSEELVAEAKEKAEVERAKREAAEAEIEKLRLLLSKCGQRAAAAEVRAKAAVNRLAEDLIGRIQEAESQRDAARDEAWKAEAKLNNIMEAETRTVVFASPSKEGAKTGALDIAEEAETRAAFFASPSKKGGSLRRVLSSFGRKSSDGASLAAFDDTASVKSMSIKSASVVVHGDIHVRAGAEPSAFPEPAEAVHAAEHSIAPRKLLLHVLEDPSLGFYEGLPVASVLVFRCCVEWRALKGGADNAELLDGIASSLHTQVAACDGDAGRLVYWLSTSLALFALLHAAGLEQAAPKPPRTSRSPGGKLPGLAGLFRRGSTDRALRTSRDDSAASEASTTPEPDRADDPLFREKIRMLSLGLLEAVMAGITREMGPAIEACLPPRPRSLRRSVSSAASPPRSPIKSPGRRRSESQTAEEKPDPWAAVLRHLDAAMVALGSAHAPTAVIRSVIDQAFAFINAEVSQ
jgi:hypothetical protein